MAFGDLESILWHLISGTKGGPSRLQILLLLSYKPMNAHQLAKEMRMDYKTVKHHLEILAENKLITVSTAKRYGELYGITDFTRAKIKTFEKIFEKLELGED